MTMSIDVPGRKATVAYKDKDQEKSETEQLDLSPSLANGVLFNVLKNFPTGNGPLKLGFVVATPKPRLVQLNITRENEATFSFAGNPHKAARFRIKIDIGGVTGAVRAHRSGKQPADINVWILENHVPAFVRMEGAFYEDGPPWTIELAAPSDSSLRASDSAWRTISAEYLNNQLDTQQLALKMFETFCF